MPRGRYGTDAPNWKGGQHVDDSGHMRVWDRARKRYVLRSHLVWLEAHPGKSLPIPTGYIIHHKDGDKLNDVPENLELMSRAAHTARHKKPAEEYIAYLQGLLDEAGIPYRSRHAH